MRETILQADKTGRYLLALGTSWYNERVGQ